MSSRKSPSYSVKSVFFLSKTLVNALSLDFENFSTGRHSITEPRALNDNFISNVFVYVQELSGVCGVVECNSVFTLFANEKWTFTIAFVAGKAAAAC